MPFEIPDANEAGDPVVPIFWLAGDSPWPGNPALWKRKVPGLLHFLQTMRIQLEISTMRHGMFDRVAFDHDAPQPDRSSVVLCCTATLSFPRHDRCEAQGYFAIPYDHMWLVEHLDGVFEDHGFPEEWREDDEVIRGVKDVVGSLVPQVQHCCALDTFGFPEGTLFAQYSSFAIRSATIPDLMVELARKAENFEFNEVPQLMRNMRSMAGDFRDRFIRWAEQHAPDEG